MKISQVLCTFLATASLEVNCRRILAKHTCLISRSRAAWNASALQEKNLERLCSAREESREGVEEWCSQNANDQAEVVGRCRSFEHNGPASSRRHHCFVAAHHSEKPSFLSHATCKDKAPRGRSTQTTPSRDLTLGDMQAPRGKEESERSATFIKTLSPS
jgi:hypothetical protein